MAIELSDLTPNPRYRELGFNYEAGKYFKTWRSGVLDSRRRGGQDIPWEFEISFSIKSQKDLKEVAFRCERLFQNICNATCPWRVQMKSAFDEITAPFFKKMEMLGQPFKNRETDNQELWKTLHKDLEWLQRKHINFSSTDEFVNRQFELFKDKTTPPPFEEKEIYFKELLLKLPPYRPEEDGFVIEGDHYTKTYRFDGLWPLPFDLTISFKYEPQKSIKLISSHCNVLVNNLRIAMNRYKNNTRDPDLRHNLLNLLQKLEECNIFIHSTDSIIAKHLQLFKTRGQFPFIQSFGWLSMPSPPTAVSICTMQ